MRKHLFARIVFLFLFVQVLSCHKFIDMDWHKHNPDCRIEKLTSYREFGPDSIVATFNYNAKGNPAGISVSDPSTGNPNYVFRYDHKGRLTDFITPYLNQSNSYEFWYKYQHDHKGRIIVDTSFGFGRYIDGVAIPNYEFMTYASYEYDFYDRLIKVTRHFPWLDSIAVGETYTYDGDGNRATRTESLNGTPGPVTTYGPYDNKVSIRRTNKIWMFLGRDYSRNNQITAEKYNKAGLPVKYRLPLAGAYPLVYTLFLDGSDIEYRCR